MSTFELMMLRFEWEEIARYFRNSPQQGTIDNLQKFVDTGARSNRFRDGYDRALEIANIIIEQANMTNEKTDLSSLCGQKVQPLWPLHILGKGLLREARYRLRASNNPDTVYQTRSLYDRP